MMNMRRRLRMFFSQLFDTATNEARGFLLIEILVALAIFLGLLIFIVNTLIGIAVLQRKERAERLVLDNASTVFDGMTRAIRSGANYHCGCGNTGTPSTSGDTTFPDVRRDCPSDNSGGGGDQCIAFEGDGGDPLSPADQIVFRLSGGIIERSQNGGATYVPLTDPGVTIERLRFFVAQNTFGLEQPHATMIVSGHAGEGKTLTPFSMQTSVAQRDVNANMTFVAGGPKNTGGSGGGGGLEYCGNNKCSPYEVYESPYSGSYRDGPPWCPGYTSGGDCVSTWQSLNTSCPASATNDYYEPNDSAPLASVLDVSYPFGIKCARTNSGDEDWFKITTAFSGTLNLKLYASASVIIDIYRASDLVTPIASTVSANTVMTVAGATNGSVYYARFRQAASSASYTMFLCNGTCPTEFNFP
jgi:type II secretory pathway pseudopilin PulG